MRITTSLDDRLREIPDDPDRVDRALRDSSQTLETLREQAEADPCELKVTRVGRQLQRHGRFLRLVHRFSAALEAKDEAIEIWRDYDRRRALFLCRVQRAVVDFEAGRTRRAVDRLEDLAGELDETTEVYRDQLEEAMGKCRYGLEDSDRAVEHLEVALEIRRRRGNRRHIERTRRMIETVREG